MKSEKTRSVMPVLTGMLLCILCAAMIFPSLASAMQTRIVVLPFYSEKGRDAEDSSDATHYRRMIGYIQNRLVQDGFEVIDPFAKDLSMKEYNRIMETARQDSALACLQVCRKYSVDAAYIVWLKVNLIQTPDGYYKADANVDGSGYDSGSRSLGVNLSFDFIETRRNADDAIRDVEKEVGDLVGRKLTAWNKKRQKDAVVSDAGSESEAGGRLAESIKRQENHINIILDGATEYETNEAFGKILNSTRGIKEAKLYSSNIQPNNPKACHTEWAVDIEGTEPFRLQANIMKTVDSILEADGEITINGVPYRYSEQELELLQGLRTGSTTTREIQFLIDRDRARDKEFRGRFD